MKIDFVSDVSCPWCAIGLTSLETALERLGPEVPVTLHFLNGMEYVAIEKATGLANGSLRGLVARGVAKLRAELAPWWRQRHANS